MNENIQLEMNPSVKKQRSIGTSIALFSQDIDNYSFDITFTDLELQAGDQVEVLAKLQGGKLEHKSSATLVEVDGELIARYVFDTKLIDSEDHVFCYVYLKRGDKSADVGAFYFEADLSELDKVGGKIAEVYDGRYEDLVAGFEIRLQEYRDSLPQASEVRAEVDVILTQFGVDGQAKLSQYDADAQQVIADNQTAFGLAESGRQTTYEQAEDSRNQASNQAVNDFLQTADAQKEAKLGEIQTDADSAISQFNQDGANEIADWRAENSAELINLQTEIAKKANKKQEDWITPTLLNGWANHSISVYSICGYYKDELGVVHLKGYVQGGSSGILFYLPEGYRPKENFYCTIPTNINGSTHTVLEILRGNGAVVVKGVPPTVLINSVSIPTN